MENDNVVTANSAGFKTIEPTMSLRWRLPTIEEWKSGNFVMGTKTMYDHHTNYILEQLHKVTEDNRMVIFEWYPVPSE